MKKTRHLFQSHPILETRLGKPFFDEIPKSPGIYRFFDEEGELLYVGKSKNLRRRLFSYKRIRPGCTSSKLSRLVSRITSITYNQTATEGEALLKENRLIREYRPEFNHVNKETETYYFILTEQTKQFLSFRLAMNSEADCRIINSYPLFDHKGNDTDPATGKNRLYGCFKGHSRVRKSLGALLQLLWITEHRAESPHQLPVQLTRNLTPLRWMHPAGENSVLFTEKLPDLIDQWLRGKSNKLTERLFELNTVSFQKNRFNAQFLESRLEDLNFFFENFLHRNHLIFTQMLDRDEEIIHQNELDDLIVKFNLSELSHQQNL